MLVFEHLPIWMFVLNPSHYNKIYFTDFLLFTDLWEHIEHYISCHTSLFDNLITAIGRKSCHFALVTHTGIVLASGSIPFFNERAQKLRKKKGIYITDAQSTTHQLPKGFLRLSCLLHKNIGGVTTFSCLYSFLPSELPITTSIIRRTVVDFFDYGLRPTTSNKPLQFVMSSSLIPVNHLQLKIAFKTHFSASGTGYRPATLIE